jgi:hypothetical protein
MKARGRAITALRAELHFLRSRYDHGAVSPAVYAVIRKIETEIGWHDHEQFKATHRVTATKEDSILLP